MAGADKGKFMDTCSRECRYFNRAKFVVPFGVLLIVLAACSTDVKNLDSERLDKTRVIELSHVQTASDFAFFHKFAEKFSELVADRSDGALEIKVIPAGQLGGERIMTEGMQLGTTDAALISSFQLGNFASPLLTFDLPFLLPDYETANEMLNSEVMEPFEDALRDAGLETLAWGNGGFRNMISNLSDVEDVSDFQDIKIRLPESRVYMDAFQSLGANPLPMAFGEVVPALQQGTIDATENSLPGIYEQRWFEVANDIAVTQHFFSPIPMLFNADLWDSFGAEEQELLRTAAQDAANYEQSFLVDVEDQAKNELLQEGVEFSYPNLDLLREKTSDLYVDFLNGENGEYLKSVLEQTNQLSMLRDLEDMQG